MFDRPKLTVGCSAIGIRSRRKIRKRSRKRKEDYGTWHEEKMTLNLVFHP